MTAELPAFADTVPACSSGTVADILGHSCTVGGNLQLSFQSWFSSAYVFDGVSSRTDLPSVNAASVLIAPSASGFTLTAPDQSVFSADNLIRTAQGVLSFSASGLNGFGITSVFSIHPGVFQVAGDGLRAEAVYEVGVSNGPTGDTHTLIDSGGTVSQQNNTQIAQIPFPSSAFNAEVYFVTAEGMREGAPVGGTASAAIAGPTSFTFNLVAVPEPSSSVLLVFGLAELAGIAWRARTSKF